MSFSHNLTINASSFRFFPDFTANCAFSMPILSFKAVHFTLSASNSRLYSSWFWAVFAFLQTICSISRLISSSLACVRSSSRSCCDVSVRLAIIVSYAEKISLLRSSILPSALSKAALISSSRTCGDGHGLPFCAYFRLQR